MKLFLYTSVDSPCKTGKKTYLLYLDVVGMLMRFVDIFELMSKMHVYSCVKIIDDFFLTQIYDFFLSYYVFYNNTT